MRITNKLVYIPYQQNLESIQNRRFKEQIRLSTGESIVNMADAPEKLNNVKRMTALINRNEQYFRNIDKAMGELRTIDDQLQSMTDQVTEIRQVVIDATHVGHKGATETLAQYVKGILEDMITKSNSEYNGQYIFSGTKTTPNSLDKTPEAQNDLPFELVEGTPSADNPSGLQIVFKGNNKSREILKDDKSTEVINTKAEDVFGAGSTELFERMIDLYNIMAYDENGNKRGGTPLTREEVGKMSDLQKDIVMVFERLNKAAAQNGAKLNRLESIQLQLQEENTRLEEIRSIDRDTDVTKAVINLQKEDTALNYSLSIGARLLPQSLFDFLR